MPYSKIHVDQNGLEPTTFWYESGTSGITGGGAESPQRLSTRKFLVPNWENMRPGKKNRKMRKNGTMRRKMRND